MVPNLLRDRLVYSTQTSHSRRKQLTLDAKTGINSNDNEREEGFENEREGSVD